MARSKQSSYDSQLDVMIASQVIYSGSSSEIILGAFRYDGGPVKIQIARRTLGNQWDAGRIVKTGRLLPEEMDAVSSEWAKFKAQVAKALKTKAVA